MLALDSDIDKLYDGFKKIVNKVTEETVGLPKTKFVDDLTQTEIDLFHKCREARKDVKRSIYTRKKIPLL